MSKRMLIDVSHPEETRVVILDGNKVEEFDFEAASKRPLKGNIYLAKVTRVEPSLQAAFVEYGGNRQGFLAFNEIHPDYYQIPVADRIALLEAQSRRLKEDEDFEAVETAPPSEGGPLAHASSDDESDEDETEEASEDAAPAEDQRSENPDAEHAEAPYGSGDDQHDEVFVHEPGGVMDENAEYHNHAHAGGEHDHDHQQSGDHVSAEMSGDDHSDGIHVDSGHLESGEMFENAMEPSPDDQFVPVDAANDEPADHAESHADDQFVPIEANLDTHTDVRAEATGAPTPARRPDRERHRGPRRRPYKIQEVIRRKQIMLVQVVKEERGNKGASLTTFLSLAGRYCVLMPNTPRGGGISRKIVNPNDRRRLKSAAQSLELPEGMGLIIRTAGANRTKVEIKRDYEYLIRLWDSVRELTLKSHAPALVYEEGNLIKRVIRDLYNKDTTEVLVDGEAGYRDAKEFMRMLLPSHAKNVKLYRDALPLFQSQHVEAQLDAMFSPTVTLKSGGYIVINQTEALVSVDVNSGRATREHSIEDTATKTNLEAADEIGRQLRLRDLAGLIVIDFIDMEDGRNDRNVEKRLRDAVRNDRARVQIGKISQFGLLEMSRQRLRAGVIAGSTVTCPHCGGQGLIRSTESAALRLLRALDEEGQHNPHSNVTVKAPQDVTIYAFNQKRRELARIEDAYDLVILFAPQINMMGGSFEIERTGTHTPIPRFKPETVSVEGGLVDGGIEADDDYVEEEEIAEEPIEEANEESAPESADSYNEPRAEASHGDGHGEGQGDSQGEGSGNPRRRRRRRRGGRGRSANGEQPMGQHAERNSGNGGERPTGDFVAHETSPEADDDAVEGANEEFTPNGGQTQSSLPQGVPGQNAETDADGKRRRRRRRRGGRGRHRRDEGGNTGDNVNNAGGVSVAGSGERIPADLDIAIPPATIPEPNAPSSPQWSLTAEQPPAPSATHEAATPRQRAPHHEQTAREAPMETVRPMPQTQANETQSGEPAGETRKGWWQRRFKI